MGRWQEYEGEARANLLRLAAVAAFYAIELINYYGVDLGFIQLPKVSDPAFHQTVTAIAAAWVLLGVGVHLWLRLHLMPAALKYVSTGLDVVLLTLLLMVADGPRSPLVVGYFLIPALATLAVPAPAGLVRDDRRDARLSSGSWAGRSGSRTSGTSACRGITS